MAKEERVTERVAFLLRLACFFRGHRSTTPIIRRIKNFNITYTVAECLRCGTDLGSLTRTDHQ